MSGVRPEKSTSVDLVVGKFPTRPQLEAVR